MNATTQVVALSIALVHVSKFVSTCLAVSSVLAMKISPWSPMAQAVCKVSRFVEYNQLQLQLLVYGGFSTVTNCSSAGFDGCCEVADCSIELEDCFCDESCYEFDDCCEDISETCPPGKTHYLTFYKMLFK